jgi:hypothetical protein
MLARIYKPAKTAMQSGKAKTRDWVLEFEPATARVPEPLNGEVRLAFETPEEAVAYAQRHGIAFQLFQPQEPKLVIKAYADNFSVERKEPWTH